MSSKEIKKNVSANMDLVKKIFLPEFLLNEVSVDTFQYTFLSDAIKLSENTTNFALFYIIVYEDKCIFHPAASYIKNRYIEKEDDLSKKLQRVANIYRALYGESGEKLNGYS